LEFDGDWANPIAFDTRGRDIEARAAQALRHYPCNLLFVHRDADGAGLLARKEEIQQGLRRAAIAVPAICVVPVRASEAWLLCEESAIRLAAGNPDGRVALSLPPVRKIENLADPKTVLNNSLIAASECTGRRRENFLRELAHRKHLVASNIADFSQLRRLPSFTSFENDLKTILIDNRLT
jgi:hypothetical protein